MKQFNYDWSDKWHRRFFALFLAVSIWYATSESLMTIRTFPGVIVKIDNLPANRTVEGISQAGILPEKTTLVLRGKKRYLTKLTSSQIEVHIDAKGRESTWTEKLRVGQLRSAHLELTRIINKVVMGEVSVELKSAIHDFVPFHLAIRGLLNNQQFRLVDFWPRKERHRVFGPEAAVRDLQSKGYRIAIDLSKVDKERLKNQWRGAIRKGDEILYLYDHPISCRAIESSVGANALISSQSMQQQPHLYFLSTHAQVVEVRAPLELDLPGRLDDQELAQLGEHLGGTCRRAGKSYAFNGTLIIRGVSETFLEIVKPNLALLVRGKGGDEHHQLPVLYWSITGIKELADRYCERVRTVDPTAIELPDQHIRRRFRHYLDDLVIKTSGAVPETLQRHMPELEETPYRECQTGGESQEP